MARAAAARACNFLPKTPQSRPASTTSTQALESVFAWVLLRVQLSPPRRASCFLSHQNRTTRSFRATLSAFSLRATPTQDGRSLPIRLGYGSLALCHIPFRRHFYNDFWLQQDSCFLAWESKSSIHSSYSEEWRVPDLEERARGCIASANSSFPAVVRTPHFEPFPPPFLLLSAHSPLLSLDVLPMLHSSKMACGMACVSRATEVDSAQAPLGDNRPPSFCSALSSAGRIADLASPLRLFCISFAPHCFCPSRLVPSLAPSFFAWCSSAGRDCTSGSTFFHAIISHPSTTALLDSWTASSRSAPPLKFLAALALPEYRLQREHEKTSLDPEPSLHLWHFQA